MAAYYPASLQKKPTPLQRTSDQKQDQTRARVALITGGGVRVGASIVRALHETGCNVAIHCRSSVDRANSLTRELNAIRPSSAITIQGDLLDTAVPSRLVAETLDAFAHLDVLVNNASSFYPTPLTTFEDAQFDDLIGTNFRAPLYMTRSCVDALRQANGCVINMGDIYAQRPLADHLIYCAAKAALISMTKSLARELGPDVRVNAISPGAILWPDTGNSDTSERNRILERTPLKRIGEPDDIARTVCFLVHDAPFITGQIIAIDGGRTVMP